MATNSERQSSASSAATFLTSSACPPPCAPQGPSDRCTLQDAAKYFSEHTNESYGAFLNLLIDAIHSRKLPSFRPGKSLRNRFDELGFLSENVSIIRPESDEVYLSDLNDWLDESEPRLTWRFPHSAGATETLVSKPLQRQLFQEAEILRVITALGHNPTQLPKPKAGKAGVKAEVRGHLKFPTSVFDKAWDRLRASKSIQDAA